MEIDPGLAERARHNLERFSQVSVESRDGCAAASGPFHAILVNAGFTHPLAAWLDSLEPDGRLLMPITAAMPASSVSVSGMLQVTRRKASWDAEFLTPVAIFASPTGRSDALNDVIRKALGTGSWLQVRRLRRDPHEPSGSCRIHADGACLSAE